VDTAIVRDAADGSCSAPQRVLRSPRYCLRLLQRGFTVQRFRPKPAAWEIVPSRIDALVPIRESDLEATKAWDGLVFDDADTV
jgi:hypothetical protein